MDIREALMLYVIPDIKIGNPFGLAEQAQAAIDGGATAVQLRNKEMSGRELFETASEIAEICRRGKVLFIVNDRVDIALASGADGVHVGQSDIPCSAVRKIVPGDFIIGVSARTVEEAVEAEKNGADYLGVGALFPTGSKDEARVIGPEGLKKITDVTSLPVVAIGGINHNNVPEAFQSGADGVSVISAVFGAKNIKKSSAELYEICRRYCIGGF